jgi:hypothetical protein
MLTSAPMPMSLTFLCGGCVAVYGVGRCGDCHGLLFSFAGGFRIAPVTRMTTMSPTMPMSMAKHVQRQKPESEGDPNPVVSNPFHRSFPPSSTRSPNAVASDSLLLLRPVHSAAILMLAC